MKFLIDNSLSPRVAQWLQDAGRDAVHVLDLGMADADDTTIFDNAAANDQVVVSMGTDFGTILAMRTLARPSVVLFRRDVPGDPRKQFDLLLANLPAIQKDLVQGAIVVFDASRIRVRGLLISE